jgi:hypothetical protein
MKKILNVGDSHRKQKASLFDLLFVLK